MEAGFSWITAARCGGVDVGGMNYAMKRGKEKEMKEGRKEGGIEIERKKEITKEGGKKKEDVFL